MTIDELWEYVCTGNLKKVKEYYNNPHRVDQRYEKFGEKHSLIMGAFRNNHFNIVAYLLQQGETITSKEQKEIDNEYKKMNIIKILASR